MTQKLMVHMVQMVEDKEEHLVMLLVDQEVMLYVSLELVVHLGPPIPEVAVEEGEEVAMENEVIMLVRVDLVDLV